MQVANINIYISKARYIHWFLEWKCKDPGYKENGVERRINERIREKKKKGRTRSNCAWMKACLFLSPPFNH